MTLRQENSAEEWEEGIVQSLITSNKIRTVQTKGGEHRKAFTSPFASSFSFFASI